jgi:hypothetical protein
MANEEYKDIKEQREKMREFQDHLGRPVDQETRERIMGICGDIDKFVIERNILAAQLAQMRLEEDELRDLRALRDLVAGLFRSDLYTLEKAEGKIDGKSVVQVVGNYLLKERGRWLVVFRRVFLGRGTW